MVDRAVSLAANAVAHFATRREELRRIDVPEWDGAVYYRPAMSVREHAAVMAHYDAKREVFDAGVFVTSMILRALDADGKPLFTSASRRQIETEFDPDVVTRIVMEMGFVSETESEADRKKK